VPLFLKAAEYAAISLTTIRTRGLRGFATKLWLIRRTDAREKRYLKRLFRELGFAWTLSSIGAALPAYLRTGESHHGGIGVRRIQGYGAASA